MLFASCFLKEPIQGHNRNQVLSELKDLKDVSDLLSMLEMAIGFLSRTGGNPEMKISYYLKTVLLLSEGKSSPKIKKVGNETNGWILADFVLLVTSKYQYQYLENQVVSFLLSTTWTGQLI